MRTADLEDEGLVHLLLDEHNVEENLLEIGMCSFKIQNRVVSALRKVKNERKGDAESERKGDAESEHEVESLFGKAANLLGKGQEGEIESWFDECTVIEVLLVEPMTTEPKRLLDEPVK